MAQVPVLDMNGKQVKTIDLPADIFEAKINKGLMHQAFVRQMANARLGTHSVKRRSEVNRTKAKMYKQKGTGRARHGARSAPQFVGGGSAFGPKPRDYSLDMPKKMRRGAIRSALSALLADGQLIFVNEITPPSPKTKDMVKVLNTLAGDSTKLVLFTHDDEMLQRTVHNIEDAKPLLTNYLNIRDLLQYGKVIVSLKALDVIIKIWGLEAKENA